MKTVLSIDPGKVNMGYGVIRYDNENHKYRVLERGMVVNTIKDLKPFNLKETILKFKSEMDGIIAKYGVTNVTMERFVSRGLMGSLSEYICIMQGVLAVHPKVEVFNLVTAATWKNSFNKQFDLKIFYAQARKLKIQPHELDAVLIGIYFLDQGSFFLSFSEESKREKFLWRLVQCQANPKTKKLSINVK